MRSRAGRSGPDTSRLRILRSRSPALWPGGNEVCVKNSKYPGSGEFYFRFGVWFSKWEKVTVRELYDL